jgi:hypothetical protein
MTDQLFIDLSTEQQETVTGGTTNNTFSDIANSIISGINPDLFSGSSSSDITAFIVSNINAAISEVL